VSGGVEAGVKRLIRPGEMVRGNSSEDTGRLAFFGVPTDDVLSIVGIGGHDRDDGLRIRTIENLVLRTARVRCS